MSPVSGEEMGGGGGGGQTATGPLPFPFRQADGDPRASPVSLRLVAPVTPNYPS